MRRILLVATIAACGRIGFDPTSADGSGSGSGLSGRNPPVITAFDVFNSADQSHAYAAGDGVTITWTVTDHEGLGDAPVSLYYSTSADPYAPGWQPIATDLGKPTGDQTSFTGSYTVWGAPSASYFVVKIVAKDASGLTGVPAVSNMQNTPFWSVYAGTIDEGTGGSALSVRAFRPAAYWGTMPFAVSPITNDIVYSDYNRGLYIMDGTTGVVRELIGRSAGYSATQALPGDDGTPASLAGATLDVASYDINVTYDSTGRLYLSVWADQYRNFKIYRIDTVAMTSVRVLGGGTGIATDPSTTAWQTANVSDGGFTLDEDGNIYYLANCTPSLTTTSNIGTGRILKRGTDGSVTAIAGSCTNTAASGGGANPMTQRLTGSLYPEIFSIAAWDHGNTIYYNTYSSTNFLAYKIIGGLKYATTVDDQALGYDRVNGRLYGQAESDLGYNATHAATTGDVHEYTSVGLAQDGGEVQATYVSGNGTGDCKSNGTAAALACIQAAMAPVFDAAGTVLFGDGTTVNSERGTMIRYLDEAGVLQTRLGTLQFYGDGVHRSLVRGKLAGLYYKQASEPNQAAFPAGLYVVEQEGPTFNYMDPVSGITTTLWGNQSNVEADWPTGTAIGKGLSLGDTYGAGNVAGVTFDSDGLPWLRYSMALVKIDANKQIVHLERGNGKENWSSWEPITGASGDPTTVNMAPYGASLGVNVKGNTQVVLLGGTATSGGAGAQAAVLDFGASTSRQLIAPNVAPLNDDCADNGTYCSNWYNRNDDKLYWGDRATLRAINVTTKAIATVLTEPSGDNIGSSILSTDGKQVYYLVVVLADGTYNLRCANLAGGSNPSCDGRNLAPGGPFAKVFTYGGATQVTNQLTWRDATHLLISTHTGLIYEYTVH